MINNATINQQAKIQADIAKYAPKQIRKLVKRVDLSKMYKFEASDLIDMILSDLWEQVEFTLLNFEKKQHELQ